MSAFLDSAMIQSYAISLGMLIGTSAIAQTSAPAPEQRPTATAPVAAATVGPAASPAVTTVVRPDAALQQQIQLQQLNAQISRELERLNNEVQIEEARQNLQEKREGSMPEFLGTFRSPVGTFAEFRTGDVVQERKTGDFVTAEWRLDEIHADRVRLCKSSHAQCRTLTPAAASQSAAK